MILHFVTWAYGPSKTETVGETDASQSFEDIAALILNGEFEDVVRVVAFDTATGAGSDVSKAMAEWLCDKSHADRAEPYYGLLPFIEKFGFTPFERPRRRESMLDRAEERYRDRLAA